MKKRILLISLLTLLAIVLVACGGKGEEDVVGDLADQLNAMQSYKAEANLVLNTGQEPLDYTVEVWHKKPEYYRIALTNKERGITQIILKNDDGVFVLTPHLNKSFRFQSDWPQSQGQVYLYESLIKDILADTNRKFSTEGNNFVFDVAANYQNKVLSHQKIALDRELKPVKLEVSDANFNVLVSVDYTSFESNPTFEEDAFEMKRNMESALIDSIPTMAEEQEQNQGSFGTYYPSYLPTNVELVEEEEVQVHGIPRVILRYAGNYHFNLIQERPQAKDVSMQVGDIIDLGFTVGVMGDGNLAWTYEGVDFLISSDNLPEEEMAAIAQSLMGQSNK
ncbi:LolA family protein [Bacillus horti]|uniref:Outer membrane lipoprotein-sorting protein n=1 Tax=Caldalkalibacillus horti TaxID=77523 RepID=A0ABT9W4T8_9BACI|nr:outer membrane lipoprotein carrier protein LolA [Bacillus horti]MDQ0168250.1 outer membrane lipoprotein-sorting protein [Bacillus horti]